MHRWFAVSMLVLFFATLLMMYFDHSDEWRAYQREFYRLEADKIAAEEQAKKAELVGLKNDGTPRTQAQIDAAYAARLAELRSAKEAEETRLQQSVSDLAEREANLKKLENDYLMQMRVVREKRAIRDVARADFDLGVRDQVPPERYAALKADFDAKQMEVLQLEAELDRRDAARLAAATELKTLTAQRDKAVAAIKAFEADIVRLETAKDRIDPQGGVKKFKRWLMEQPIIDGFNSHIKIVQDWLPDMKITLGMAKTARFDRCRTCHLAIDRVGPGNVPDFPHGDGSSGTYPHPFSTHPRPDVYLTAASPHPLSEFGCTSCHDGQGSGTSFTNASHTPNDPHQAHEWEHEYHWFNNHFWEYPMQPARLRESACLKCHHSVVELGVNKKFGPTAPKVYEGWQLIKKYGCFGCHEINGYDAGKPIGPDLRLEPQTAEEAQKIAEDPKAVAGQERKVGPSLRHVASKTTKEWLTFWTEEPKRFRKTTTMPQFFNLSNNSDPHGVKFSKVELVAIAHYLFDKSEPLKLDTPPEGYQPDAKRGETFFAHKGCLACHSHDADRFQGSNADFGPNLSKVAAKLKPGADGFNWLYTWIREPERHHPRTRMPDLFLDPDKQGDVLIDPAADIAAYLLSGATENYPAIEATDADLDELVELLLARRKTVTPAQAKEVMSTRKYPLPRESVKGDEIELVADEAGAVFSDEEWRSRKLNYLGRVTISRYGCYGCHDIPNFETARPIGTALQDWGLKDPSRLAPEHIEEYLHHHGEPDGRSTRQRVEEAIRKKATGDFDSQEEADRELGAAFFYESLLHHGRPGFIWQKLRDPRSYDYEKTETKFYDERLRMPKFPLNEREIEAISTFVLGLVARPPAEKYQFRPTGAELAKVEGEKLLQKFNCTGCHMIDLPEISYATDPASVLASEMGVEDHQEGFDLLMKLKPPRNALTGKMHTVKTPDGEQKLPVVMFRGLPSSRPNPEDDPEEREYGYDLWETIDIGEKRQWAPMRIIVPQANLVSEKPARGGQFAEWLVGDLKKLDEQVNAWQNSPPILYLEGIKVQTPWLYSFLKNPVQLRHTTVLRMPRFNMSDEEARALANYFAAYDGAAYPYQDVPQRTPAYLSKANQEYHERHPDRPGDYLAEAWRVLNAPICVKCHSVAGQEYKKSTDPKDVRGPNLEYVTDRLRPDWLQLWLFKPGWITPYTSMPPVFRKDQKQFAPLMDGDPRDQVISVRDALMNYTRLLEREGKLPLASVPAADATPATGTAKEGGNP
jgi:mono/diheme cytochrome c family protein